MKNRLCVIAALALLLCPLAALGDADDGLCFPWFNLNWDDEITAGTEESAGMIYVGVYPCRYVFDLSAWPEELSMILEPVDADRIEGLSRKAVNDCWSFYGVYPELMADENTYFFNLGESSVFLVIEENDIRVIAVAQEQ